jgi:hypothetical protein
VMILEVPRWVDAGRGSCETNNGEIQGSLHCAANDEAVRGFGRDDVSFDFP